MDFLCYNKTTIEEINKRNINRIYPYADFIIVTMKGSNSGVFVFDTTKNLRFVTLETLVPDDPRKISIAFRGFDMYVSLLVTNGQVDVYQISLEKHVQKKIKSLKSKARCSTDIGSSSFEQFVVTIYSKCKNSPPKITTYRSTNMEVFTKDIYYPKSSILGEEDLQGICMFKKGVLFVAKNSIFFFNRKNNFFI